MKIKEALAGRNVPDVLCPFGKRITTWEEFEAVKPAIQKLLAEEEYGFIPPKPDRIEVEKIPNDYHENRFCAGFATLSKMKLTAHYGDESTSFVFYSTVPKNHDKKMPIFININFGSEIPHKYQPTDEIMDNGCAVFTIYYQDVTSDDGDFKNGCAALLCKDRSDPHAPGKIAIWAWSIMRVIDYIETLDIYNPDAIAVIGHSRLGKTTLLTAAYDERVKFACVNNSGASGDALSRGKVGEDIAAITKTFPFWFCPNYLKYAGREDSLPFDQHYLLSLVAPRHILVGTALEDTWADPNSEYLALTLTDEVYKLYGSRGFVHTDNMPSCPERLAEGDCYFHLREGLHYLSRKDWLSYIDYIKSKL